MALLFVAALPAQEADQGLPPDVEHAVREGSAETLETKFRGGRTPDEIHLIAQSYANRARRAKSNPERERALDEAERRYRSWIAALEKVGKDEPTPKSDVAVAAARVEYAGLLMGLRAASDLDPFEITAGRQGDRDRIRTVLTAAREQYAQAAKLVHPLHEQLGRREDELLAAGIYDTIIQLKLDITFNEGWAGYYLGLIEPPDDPKRTEALRLAEQRFQEMLDSGRAGRMTHQCYLGLAMAQRELKRYAEAERNFALALREGPEPAVEAQARCELARLHVVTGKFAEARTVLEPVAAKDGRDLSADSPLLRFYVNLALLLDASSYLGEADTVRTEAAGSAAKAALLRRADRARETGLAKLSRLAGRGGPWPAIVQIYISANIDLRADITTLSPTELLYTARYLLDGGQPREALRRLREAWSRPEFQKPAAQRSPEDMELAGRLLLELGKAHYRSGDPRQAATTFDRLAREFRGHESAPQGATFAYQLWVEIARKGKQREDYARLADTLLNLIQSFPDHPERGEALWLLPVAWQAAGRYAQAADEFAKVPPSSKHHEEAQFRVVLCRRLALEGARGGQSREEYAAQAQAVATALLRYAEQATRRAADLTKLEAQDVLKGSAEARVNAAELFASAGVEQFEAAIRSVEGFEILYPDSGSDVVGRVLAVRIRAYRGLRQFPKATELLERYLQTVPAERAGAVLASLAHGMQEEVERLHQDGQVEAARQLAAESVDTFVQLEQWLQKDAKRASQAAVVAFGRAEMLYTAGNHERAQEIVTGLLKQSPQNGNYQRLLALIRSAQLTDASSPEQVQAARDAWEQLLKDPALRKRAPERYWEARYHWLALLLRQGRAADVDQAIQQDAVWYPDLGGPPWRDKLLDLRRQARATLGWPEEDLPATAPAETKTP